MESLLRFSSTLFFASLLLFVSSLLSTMAATQFVKTVCKETSKNAECLKALHSDPRTASASNYEELAQIVLELAVKNAKDSQTVIHTILIKSLPSDTNIIQQCADAYKSVALNFKNAIGELDKDPKIANYDIKMAVRDSLDMCEHAIKEGVNNPEISSRNNLMYLYSDIGDVITNKL